MLNETQLYTYFINEENLLGTYAQCLPLLVHNLEGFVDSMFRTHISFLRKVGDGDAQVVLTKEEEADLVNDQALTLAAKILILQGSIQRFKRVNYQVQHGKPMISTSFYSLLEDLRTTRNPTVQTAGFFYAKVLSFATHRLNSSGKSLIFTNTSSNFQINVPEVREYESKVVATRGIILNNTVESTIPEELEYGEFSNHHFAIQIYTNRLFKENCAKIYPGELEKSHVLVYYYGKHASVYDVDESQIKKLKTFFGQNSNANPYTVYFRFRIPYFLTQLTL
eukprot:c1699_g1_i1.p1 GENE.c1699_g1_i1~~c1699_g1_i1.p1  ORF type:complete len:280 (+),score=11.67 c1699_g1_i1:49-888(+)